MCVLIEFVFVFLYVGFDVVRSVPASSSAVQSTCVTAAAAAVSGVYIQCTWWYLCNPLTVCEDSRLHQGTTLLPTFRSNFSAWDRLRGFVLNSSGPSASANPWAEVRWCHCCSNSCWPQLSTLRCFVATVNVHITPLLYFVYSFHPRSTWLLFGPSITPNTTVSVSVSCCSLCRHSSYLYAYLTGKNDALKSVPHRNVRATCRNNALLYLVQSPYISR